MLNFCWSNTKRFLSVLVVFGKYFAFAKIVKNFKNSVVLFWRLGCGSVQLHAPNREHYLENIRDSLAGQSPGREKYLENFSKFGFLGFSQLRLATCSRMEAPVASVTQKFSRLPSRLPRGWNIQLRKTLGKIFQKFHLRCLAACSSDLSAT